MHLVRFIAVHNFLDTTLTKVIAALIVLPTLVMLRRNCEKGPTFGVSAKRLRKKFVVFKHLIGYGKLTNKVYLRLKSF